MAYDEKLAERVRKALAQTHGIVEKNMFGGVAFLMRGNMLVGVHKDELIARVAPEETDRALRDSNARIFDITGRPMKGWILVKPSGVVGSKLGKWIERARGFVETLPAK
jgi:TfoX N-terminal domain